MNIRGNSVKNLNALLLLIVIAALSSGCPTTPIANGPSATPQNSKIDEPKPVETEKGPSNSNGAPGSLATPTDAYRTAYEMRKNKDIEGLKKVLSAEILEFFTEMGKVSDRSLDEMLMDLANKPQADRPESRNEKIDGDHATVQFKNEKGEWSEMDFVKENGGWKLTLPKADPSGPITEGNRKN
ncbi:MAG: hypothetical protein AB7V11_14820 [Pyrinomonadaceae bacterium]